MSSESTVAFKSLPAPDAAMVPSPPPAEQQPQQVNLFKLLHRHLRGRYRLTITLALLGAIVGGVGGYLVRKPKYRAEALIRVQPVLPRILYQSEESTLQPMFSSFVSTQANLLQNSRVVEKAMNSPEWRALGRGNLPEDEVQFNKELLVKTSHDAPELIFVSYTDNEAQAAFVAVTQVISAYQELFAGAESKSSRDLTLKELTSLKASFEKDKHDKETQISARLAPFQSDDLARLSDHSLSNYFALQDRVTEAAIVLTERGIDPEKFHEASGSDRAGDQAGPPAPPPTRTPEQIATVDRTMQQYLVERDGIQRQLIRLRQTGIGEQHQSVKSLVGDLDAINKVIQDRAEKWIEPASPTGSGPLIADATPAQLVARYRRLLQQAETLKAETESLSKAKLDVENLRNGLKVTQDKLDDVNHRLDQINVESKVQDQIGRIEFIRPDSPPSSPNDDPRKKFAAIGFIFGGGLPVGIMFLLGLADRRFRYADQAGDTGGAVPMLGILPELPGDGVGSDPEQVAAAVHCIHHIRTRLQLSNPIKKQCKVYTVTSPTAGDGKTSLALSLGMSFISSGERTLLVDFDLVGHALSTRLGASGEHGVGHHLVAPNGHSLVTPTPVPNLSLIAAGTEDVRFHSRVGREAFARMIDGLRDKYDVIIVDTGPILGSLEANIAVSQADGVVLVVGRGQVGSRVREALSHVTNLGVPVAGMVFNRAHAMDFSRSTIASASVRSIRSVRAADAAKPQADIAPANVPPIVAGLDPLARSVAQDVHK